MNHLFVSSQTWRHRTYRMLLGMCLTALVLGSGGFVAWAQDKALPPGDVISARKTLMSVIARNMYPLD